MNIIVVLMVGTLAGVIDGAGIFFAPGEPYKIEIFLAASLKGILVSLLTVLSIRTKMQRWRGLGYGLLYGAALAIVVFLAKGGLRSTDTAIMYVIPSGVVMGASTGLLVSRFALRRA